MTKDLSCSKNCEYCGEVFFRDKRNTWKYWEIARFCSRKCSSLHSKREYRRAVPDLKTAFFRKALVASESDCWEWGGLKDKDGYPILPFDKKTYRANRVALIISGIEISAGQHACHKCGNAWCCNPKHIYAGSPKQNNSDKLMHGTNRAGADVHFAKLTEEQVRQIRRSNESNRDLAQLLNVSRTAIWLVRQRKTWRHVA